MGSEVLTEKQRRILEAAIDLFSEKGFDRSSTAEIAQRAGVAEGTIFKHFKTKRDLLIRAINPFVSRFASVFVLPPVRALLTDTGTPVREVFRRLIIARLVFVEEHWSETRIIALEILKVNELKDAVVQNIGLEARKLLEGFLTSRIETGELRQVSPNTAARMIIGSMAGYIIMKHAFPAESKEWSMDEQIEDMLDLILNGLSAK
jgi:AcrR family transcriptional regulator